MAGPQMPMRTGWISFVAVLAGIAGVFNFLSGIAAIGKDDRTQQYAKVLFDVNITTWGWIWLVLGAVQLFAAVLIYMRHPTGLVLGVAWAGVSAALEVFVIFSFPLYAILMMALYIAILGGLLNHAEEFDA